MHPLILFNLFIYLEAGPNYVAQTVFELASSCLSHEMLEL